MEFADFILTPKLDGVSLHTPLHEPVDGTLCITGHHLILSSRREGAQELWLLHQCIDHIERRPNATTASTAATAPSSSTGGTLVLRCKDLRIISLTINDTGAFHSVATSIEKLASLRDVRQLYAFFYRPMYAILEDGYTAFGAAAEWAKLLATGEWRLSTVNAQFTVCPTYAASLVVPASITDDDLRSAAAFRDGGRFPMFAYRHDNGCVLLRSAAPSQAASRSRADERLLNAHLRSGRKGFIVDTWGRGVSEVDQHYAQWRKICRPVGVQAQRGLANVSGTLDAFARMVEACNDTGCSTERWLSRTDGSGWMALVLNALNTACVVAQCLQQDGSPVLVTGGSGQDMVLLVTSLVQVILCPDSRTVRGLQALIEREWIQAGYPFGSRHRRSAYAARQRSGTGNLGDSAGEQQAAATFVLLLDCVYQLHVQFPCSFEFDAELLVVLFEHSFASQYGTFLADSERERDELGLHRRTTSLWSYLNRPNVLQTLLNPIYRPNQDVIWPSVAPISLEVWSPLFLRWVVDQTDVRQTARRTQALMARERALRTEAMRLRKAVLERAAAAGCPTEDDATAVAVVESVGTLSLDDDGDAHGTASGLEAGGATAGSAEAVSSGGSPDGGSTSSGLGGSSSTIASSSSGGISTGGAGGDDGVLVLPASSGRRPIDEIDHPLQLQG